MRRIATLLLLTFFVVAPLPVGAGQVKQLAKLVPSGRSVGNAVAVAGDTIVIGAPNIGRSGEGRAFAYVKSEGRLNLVAEFGPGLNYTGYGYSVAISGDTNTIAVGAPGGKLAAIYVFVKPATGWQDMPPTATLTSSRLELGRSLSISSDGTTLVAGVPGAHGPGGRGAAYVFEEPAVGWQDVTAPTATLSSPSSSDLGYSVAMTDDTIVAGSPDDPAAYVFVKPPTGWENAQPTARLTPSDATGSNQFGASVAISGNTIAVGAPLQSNVGAAYVFVEPLGGWQDMTQTAVLSIQTEGPSNLGFSVAVENDAILAGDPDTAVGQIDDQGIAAAYLRPTGGWVDTTTPDFSVTSLGGVRGEFFGTSVAIESTVAVIGAPGRTDNGAPNGAVFVFGEQ